MNNNFIEKLSEENLQHGSVDPPLWDGFFVLVLKWSTFLSKKQTEIAWTQVGTQMWWDDSGDDENDQGEEWMEKTLYLTK